MRRLLSASLSLLLAVAALYSSAAPVSACTCALLTEPDEVKGVMEYYGLVVEGVIAPDREIAAEEYIRFQPEIVYAGEVNGEIALNQTWGVALQHRSEYDSYDVLDPMCGYSLIGEPGDRYVLFLQPAEGGRYAPAGCASFAVDEIETAHPEWAAIIRDRYETLKLVSGGGTVVEAPPAEPGGDEPVPEPDDAAPLDEPAPGAGGDGAAPQEETDDEHTEGTPWEVILPLAFGIPLAVLIVPALLRRRG